MIIKLWDKTEITVTAEQAEQVKQAIENDANHIEVKGNWIRCSAISMIKQGGIQEIDRSKTLPTPELTDEERRKARLKVAEIRKKISEGTLLD